MYAGTKKKHREKQGFEPILHMLGSPNSTLSLLAYSSLYGFIFTLDLSRHPEEAEFFNLTKGRFTVPVVRYILKFALITSQPRESLPPLAIPPETYEKSTEKEVSFFKEAQLQQHIWKNSIVGGREPVCPPVSTFSFFDNTRSQELLQVLLDKLAGQRFPPEMHALNEMVIRYMLDALRNSVTLSLGVIVMPLVSDAKTLRAFSKDKKTTRAQLLEALCDLTAKVIRLFIETGVVHVDLHPNNALVYQTPSGDIDTLIIDFGRATNVKHRVTDRIVSVDQKDFYSQSSTYFYNHLLTNGENIMTQKQESRKINFVREAMRIITSLDNEYNRRPDLPDDYQMNWYEVIKTNDAVLTCVYDVLYESIHHPGLAMLRTTIEKYENRGFLVKLNQPIQSYYSTVLPEPPPPPSAAVLPVPTPSPSPPSSAPVDESSHPHPKKRKPTQDAGSRKPAMRRRNAKSKRGKKSRKRV